MNIMKTDESFAALVWSLGLVLVHLEPSELFLFTPIIKGSDKDHYDHSE